MASILTADARSRYMFAVENLNPPMSMFDPLYDHLFDIQPQQPQQQLPQTPTDRFLSKLRYKLYSLLPPETIDTVITGCRHLFCHNPSTNITVTAEEDQEAGQAIPPANGAATIKIKATLTSVETTHVLMEKTFCVVNCQFVVSCAAACFAAYLHKPRVFCMSGLFKLVRVIRTKEDVMREFASQILATHCSSRGRDILCNGFSNCKAQFQATLHMGKQSCDARLNVVIPCECHEMPIDIDKLNIGIKVDAVHQARFVRNVVAYYICKYVGSTFVCSAENKRKRDD